MSAFLIVHGAFAPSASQKTFRSLRVVVAEIPARVVFENPPTWASNCRRHSSEVAPGPLVQEATKAARTIASL